MSKSKSLHDPVSYEYLGKAGKGFPPTFRIHGEHGVEIADPGQIVGLPERRRTGDVKAYIRQFVDQMIILRESTILLRSYNSNFADCVCNTASGTARLEVRVSKELPEPKGQDFYDAIDTILNKAHEGVVAMRTENATHTFFDCDVRSPKKAAMTILKGLRALGYEDGVEVYSAEPGGKQFRT
jgi:hypothetical protein